jgi:hypothetical protein
MTMTRSIRSALGWVAAAALALAPLGARAEEATQEQPEVTEVSAAPTDTAGAQAIQPSREEFEDALPEGAEMTGEDIYKKFLDNKIHAFKQYSEVVSRDPGGNEQTTKFWVRWKDFRDAERKPDADGIEAKSLIRVTAPIDVRNTAYLIVQKEGNQTEQWIYQPAQRKTRRVKLQGVSLFGTDYTFADIAFQDIDDADYKRLPDEEIGGIQVYVVEATMKPEANSQYKKTVSYLTKDHYVALRGRFWDQSGVEIKEMNADPKSVKSFDEVWVATESVMTDKQASTSTKLLINNLDTKANFENQMFTLHQLPLLRD